MTVMRDHPCQPLTGYVSMDDGERIARVTAFRALMAGRRTVRDFSDRPVPRAVVEQALLTAGSAPSGANHQPWFFSVIESASARGRIRAAAEAEEREFYATKAPQEWLEALAPLGTDPEKPFLLLVAGHPAEDATVPTAALNKKPLGGIAAWI
jgi:iodotyrosine deiodinase